MPVATADLTLPREAYAKISPAPYLTAHLLPADPSSSSIRPNGRTPSQFRTPACQTGSLTHCAGSAVVRLGNTAVVCGIQAEIALASSVPNPPHTYDPTNTGARQDADANELAHLNLLVPNVELATGCSPQHLPGSGGPPSTAAQTLAQRLLALLLSSRIINLDDLKIQHTPAVADGGDTEVKEETVAYWILYPSVHVMSLDGENSLLDATWASLVAALRNLVLPKASWNADLENVVCSEQRAEARQLNLQCRPFVATWGVFRAHQQQVQILNQQRGDAAEALGKPVSNTERAWMLADPDDFEDALCKEIVTVVMDCSSGPSRILRLEKYGGVVIGASDLKEILTAAEARWKQWASVIPG